MEFKNDLEFFKHKEYVQKWIAQDGENLIEIKEQYGNSTDLGSFKTISIWYQVAVILLHVGKEKMITISLTCMVVMARYN